MAIIRVKKKEHPFVMIDKTSLNDVSLSWQAKGLLAYLVSLPDNWEVRVKDLINRSTNGRDSVYTILRELKMHGYAQFIATRDEQGKVIRCDYLIYEIPQHEFQNLKVDESAHIIPLPEKPLAETPLANRPLADSQDSIINNKDTKYTINKIITAAAIEEVDEEKWYCKKATHAAADDDFCLWEQHDLVIGKSLTHRQALHVEQLAKQCQLHLLHYTTERLGQELKLVLLNPNHFTQAGNDFLKKCNTLKKQIEQKKWIAPQIESKKNNPPISFEKKQLKKMFIELSEAAADRKHWSELLVLMQSQGKTTQQLHQNKQLADKSQAHYEKLLTHYEQFIRTHFPSVSANNPVNHYAKMQANPVH